MPRLLIRPLAEADLLEIWGYIALDSLPQADRFLDQLEDAFSMLLESPLLGRDRSDLLEGLRSFPLKRYIIFYRSQRDGNVEIIRVLHGARDIEILLKNAV